MSESELARYVHRQREFSERTFGPGRRTKGLVEHIRKELEEILEQPLDLEEWIDVIILAIDGYWRAGGNPDGLMATLQRKQKKNIARSWPKPESEDVPVEHVREDVGETGSARSTEEVQE